MIVTTNEIKNNAIFIRYLDIDNYHYSTYCSPSINDIAREINTNLTTLKP
jgi:hypothetical protein